MNIFKLLAVWISYFIPFIHVLPLIGKVEEADCIAAQAFGRNDFEDKVLVSMVTLFRKRAGMNDLETFRILKKEGFDSGKANIKMGRFCLEISKKFGIPVIAQWEIPYAMFCLDPKWCYKNPGKLKTIWPEGGYFAAYHVIVRIKEIMKSEGCNKPLLVSQAAMMARVLLISWRLELAPIIPKDIMNLFWVWDPGSVQPWVRNPYFGGKKPLEWWYLRETCVRIHHIRHGWISFFPSK